MYNKKTIIEICTTLIIILLIYYFLTGGCKKSGFNNNNNNNNFKFGKYKCDSLAGGTGRYQSPEGNLPGSMLFR